MNPGNKQLEETISYLESARKLFREKGDATELIEAVGYDDIILNAAKLALELPDFMTCKEFVYNPSSATFHADDGGNSDACVKWVRDDDWSGGAANDG